MSSWTQSKTALRQQVAAATAQPKASARSTTPPAGGGTAAKVNHLPFFILGHPTLGAFPVDEVHHPTWEL